MDTPTAKAAWNANYGVVGSGDRRLAFSRQLSSNATTPRLARSDSSISMPAPLPLPPVYEGPKPSRKLLRLATASRPMRRLALLLALNVAYSATEFAIGLFTGRVGLVSDAFHLTFGCGLLTFSLFAMAASRTKPDNLYTYGPVSSFPPAFQALFLFVCALIHTHLLLSAFFQVQAIGGSGCLYKCYSCFYCSCLSPWLLKHYMHLCKMNRSTSII
uniref:Cation efflux protein transmembrane domain-containing protein n=1 Tax=Zea mays TaxID=4577 RepID=C0HGS3_MAIZE|nr:unknown [Zea mays]